MDDSNFWGYDVSFKVVEREKERGEEIGRNGKGGAINNDFTGFYELLNWMN